MYRKKFYKCDCCDCEPEDVFGNVEDAIRRIKDGRKDILHGLHLICCCCRICEGIRCIERGICKIEKGLAELVDGLKCFEFECDYKNDSNIKAGICGVKDALHCLKKGLCQLQNCCLCDGIESIQCGLQYLDEALCYLEKGVGDMKCQKESWRKGCC
ncbi:MAG TPA: hypothetical protein VFC96_02355 [Anaerovoracaceae bacterium]|nr:hypothetical protein [Anaerovoracaceae bacterium]